MNPQVSVSVRLDFSMAERAKNLAAIKRWSMSLWVREAIEEKIERELNESK